MKNNYKYLHDILGSNIKSDKNINFTDFFKNKGKKDDGSQLDNTIKYTFFADTNIFIKLNYIDEDNKLKIDVSLKKQNSNNKDTLYTLHYYQHFLFKKNEQNDILTLDDIDIQKISKIIRNSKTFIPTDANSFFRSNLFFAICEKGFILCDTSSENTERLNRVVMLFILAIAYNLKIEKLLLQCAEIYDNSRDETDEITKFRESIFEFNLKYFFEFPVKEERHETMIIWKLISNTFFVKQKHDEVNAQVLDLTKIIVQNQEKEEREKNEKSQQDKQAQDSKIQNNVAIIGLVIAFAPLIMDFVNLIIETCSKEYKDIIKIVVQLLLITFGILTVIKVLKSEYIQNKLNNFLHTKKNE